MRNANNTTVGGGAGTKLPYRAPQLTTYGSVRDLTGSLSGTNMYDSMSMMLLV